MLIPFLVALALVLLTPCAITLAVDGRKRMLNAYMRNANTNITFRFHLYSNAAVIAPGMVIGAFTESAFPGYAAQNKVAADWSAPTDDGTCSTTVAPAPIVWTATGASAENAVGYYVTDNADGALLHAEAFPAAIDMSANGKTTTLYPAFQDQTGAPC